MRPGLAPTSDSETKHWANDVLVTFLWFQSNLQKSQSWLLFLTAAVHARTNLASSSIHDRLQLTVNHCRNSAANYNIPHVFFKLNSLPTFSWNGCQKELFWLSSVNRQFKDKQPLVLECISILIHYTCYNFKQYLICFSVVNWLYAWQTHGLLCQSIK